MSVNSKMTALADEIRELSGTTGTMGLDAMESHISEANTDIDTEADLIAQISSALEGKAAGGSSSGGTSVETCTVTIDDVNSIGYVGIDDNGNVIYCQSINNYGNTLSVNIVKGTIFCVLYEHTVMIQNRTSGIESGISYSGMCSYYLKSEAANTEVITIMTD